MNKQLESVSEIWFWQLMISPHMAEISVELAKRGCRVICVASQAMSSERSMQGWVAPSLPGVAIEWADSNESVERLINTAAKNSVHLCQGIRANGRVALAQKKLAIRGLKQFVVMEMVEDSGWRGIVKRFIYRRLFRIHGHTLEGVLAIGYRTGEWVAARGLPAKQIFPFAYFLSDQAAQKAFGSNNADLRSINRVEPKPFRFIFVGQLIARKRVDWLIGALAKIENKSFELLIVGAGSAETTLSKFAAEKLGNRVRWLGQIAMSEVPSLVAQADCLVLPSVHDGWGVVCSEALMVGTPVICSDACGVSGVVKDSGVGGVFPRDDIAVLHQLLARILGAGCVTVEARSHIAQWAQALGAAAGTSYLLKILGTAKRPVPPWQCEDRAKTKLDTLTL